MGSGRTLWNQPKERAAQMRIPNRTTRCVAVRAIVAVLVLGFIERASAQAVPLPDVDAAAQVQATQTALPPLRALSNPVPSPPVASPQVPVPAPETKPPSVPAASVSGPGRFVLEMHDGTLLTGVFGETKAVPFEAVFGRIEIPVASIRVLDFAVVINGAKTHRVHFVNGDMLTGSVGQLAPVKFQTSYGVLLVPMEDVLKVSSGPSLQLAANRPPTNARRDASGPGAKNSPLPSVPVPDEPPGPIRPRGRIVPDAEVR